MHLTSICYQGFGKLTSCKFEDIFRHALSPNMTTPVQIAFGKEKGALRAALKTILGDALVAAGVTDGTEPELQIIGLVIPIEHDGRDWAEQAAQILDWNPRCRGLVVAWDGGAEGSASRCLCPKLRAALRAPFDEAVKCVGRDGKLLENLLGGVKELRAAQPTELAMRRVADIVHAAELYRHLEIFSHGGRDDITNRVLAPLRLLLGGGAGCQVLTDEWKNEAQGLLTKFKGNVVDLCDHSWWLSAELKDSFAKLPENLTESEPFKDEIERILDLLTECRVLAGANPTQAATGPVPVDPLREGTLTNGQAWPYEVLVIDDHAEAWRPVFAKLQAAMAKKDILVAFEFLTGISKDGESELLAKLPDYDAVLLDVFLPGDLDGIEILRQIRRHYVNLPVVIWTSSRAPELPADARLAHGFLFKKSTTLAEMEEMLQERFLEGNAKRRYPLPGHFFDHSIRRRANRKSALRMSEYCLKHLDSFHAMDESYFRFFTDHGGRHLLKLVELLGETLRSLVADPAVFSTDDAAREEEILSLYLAVFLHEFGMLRLKGTSEPDWDRLVGSPSPCRRAKLQRELALVRALHAPRGMVLLAQEPGISAQHWPDEEGSHQAKKRLWKEPGHYLRSAVALITGHHSRLLPLNHLGNGGGWNHDFEIKFLAKASGALTIEPSRKVSEERARRFVAKRFYSLDSVKKTLDSLLENVPEDRRERLRRHCAIFRFVDAIDVDHTRNPASFLCRAGRISEFDCRETLKRQVVRHVRIEGGRVSMETNVETPCPKVVLELAANVEGIANADDLKAWIAEPWKDHADQGTTSWRIACHEAIDKWLARFWKNPREVEGSFLDRSSGLLSRDSKIQIASLTALSAAWEILSEYQAIIDCELADKITLGKFWREKEEPDGWANSQEKMLPILFHPDDGLDVLMR